MKHIHKHVHMPHMYMAAFLGSLLGLTTGLSGIFPSSAASFSTALLNIVGIYGNTHTVGVFDQTPAGGNFGKITLIPSADESTVGGSGIYLDTTTSPQTLTGSFFSETMGWFTIIKGDLIPPANMNPMTPWIVDGYAWSNNGGYVDFIAQNTSYSGVAYTPGTQTFTGYAWSNSGGYLPFGGMTAEFRNRVKILGNIGGAKSFDTEYALGTKFDAVNTTSMINTVRKNVSLITRASTKVNMTNATNTPLNGVVYYKKDGYDFVANKVDASKLGTNRTLIVDGGDIIIMGDVPNGTSPKALIAIKDAAGKGGNIYIRGDVKNIYATLIAEGTIYSGESTANTYNDTTAELTQLPKNQLYILGSVISRNTIGGSAKSPAICPFTETNCTYTSSFAYDWNYFRTYDGKVATKSAKNGYDNYSVIIESDPRMTANPPPGLTQ